MRALVTGGAGFLGSHLIDALTDAGHEPIGLDRRSEEFGSIIRRDLQLAPGSPIRGLDVIFSLAATADPIEAQVAPAIAYRNSTGLMVSTLQLARDAGVPVIHVSSNEAIDPTGPYGGAKACQEIVCRAQQDVPVRIAVLQSLFGPRQQPEKLIPTTIRKLLAGQPVPLQACDGRVASRPWTYAPDVAQSLAHLLSDPWDAHSDTIYLGGRPISNLRIVELVAEQLGRPAVIELVPCGDRPGHELEPAPIGWSPDVALFHTPLEEAVAETVDWFTQRQTAAAA